MTFDGSLRQNDVFAFIQEVTRTPWSPTAQIEINLGNFTVEDGIAMLALVKVLETYRQKTAGLTLRDPSAHLLRQLEEAGLFDGPDGISIIADEIQPATQPPTQSETEIEKA